MSRYCYNKHLQKIQFLSKLKWKYVIIIVNLLSPFCNHLLRNNISAQSTSVFPPFWLFNSKKQYYLKQT